MRRTRHLASQTRRSVRSFRSGRSDRWVKVVTRLARRVAARITLGAVCASAAFVIFFKLAHEVLELEAFWFDARVAGFFRSHQQPWLHTLMLWVSWTVDPSTQAVAVVLWLFGLILARRAWPDAPTLVLATLGSPVLVHGLKVLFARPRPTPLVGAVGYSFPSGHSFSAVVLFGLAAYWLAQEAPPGRQRWIWGFGVTLILLVGFSRVYLGAHYFSDVLGGYAVAVPWLWGWLALPAAFGERRSALAPRLKGTLRSGARSAARSAR